MLFLTKILTFLLLNVGQRTTPSVVAFADDGTRHVGDVAKRQVSLLRYLRLALAICGHSNSVEGVSCLSSQL